MEPQFQSNDRGFTELVNEIVSDFQKLIRQELALAKTEISKDWVRGKNAIALYGGACIAFLFAAGLGLLALARAMVELGIPLGIAYFILSLALIGIGIAAYFLGKRWAQAIKVVPTETAENIQENVQWLRKRI